MCGRLRLRPRITHRYELESGLAELTPAERAQRGKAARAAVPRESHAVFDPGPDRPDPIALLEEQAKARVPELVPIRRGRMMVSRTRQRRRLRAAHRRTRPVRSRLARRSATTTRKIPKPLDAPAAARIIGDLAHWHVHAPAAGDVLAAIEIHQRTGASFWDAMILRSAKELGCGTLHAEDLNPGQAYEGVQVCNPFLT